MNKTVAGKSVGVPQGQERGGVDSLRGSMNFIYFFFFLNGRIQEELLTNSLWAGTVLLCGCMI